MAEPQSTKRARSISIVYVDTTAPLPEEISQRVQELDPQSIANILAYAARIHPDVMYMVDQAIHVTREREQNSIRNFDQDSTQYDISDLVADEVLDTIESITEYCGQFANPQTRLNWFSALRKIGKTIALSTNDTLGREVQERFQSDASLVDGMMKIINFMTPVEVRVIIEHKSNPNALWSKLQELEELAQNECIHPGIEEVLNLLDPARDEYEEEIDEDEDEDDAHQA
ncbi:hypothetical protein N7536_004778 [Penicillium majusculum]|uniref:Uncharacterized protein n=1 Tax=Penicillium solitum TaxID=60172 RepID=A0A1V6QDW3_9EURO|nr:uncharacterized protein PENSOL_c078G11801 [Penicillium solitum]KAJ5694366.1 hypothetical protein N7536_004778 [Penicillium majusculum]OQD87394.1 hypothetical protein PENSOL_c078G11801 [Penicillium solitum]